MKWKGNVNMLTPASPTGDNSTRLCQYIPLDNAIVNANKNRTRQLISIFLSCTIYLLSIDKSKSSMRRTSIKILVIQLEMKRGLWLSFMTQKFNHMNCGVENWFETSVQYITFQIKFLFSTRFEKWRVQPQWILLWVITKGELS